MKRNTVAFQAGMFLISILFFTVLVSTAFFIFKLPVGQINIGISIVLSVVMCYFIGGRSLKKTTPAVVIGIVLFIACVIASGYIYDWSYDGNTYHKSMIGLLEHGWNPLYITFYDYADLYFPQIEAVQTWYDAYPKAAEIFAACVYSATGNIESGKSMNMISMIAVALIAYSYLRCIDKLKWWQVLFCAILLTVNPIMISQLFTYYVDGYLWNMILLCLMACAFMTFTRAKYGKRIEFYLIFLGINIGFNIKFSGIIFFGLFCLGFFIYWCVQAFAKKEFAASFVKSVFVALAFSVMVAVIFTGATSYVINTVRYHNPLYTLIGEGSSEIIDTMVPVVYRDMSKIERVLTSVFSSSNADPSLSELQLKIPFTFRNYEISNVQTFDVRQGGWGVFFSGIIILVIPVLIAAIIDWRKKYPHVVRVFLIFISLEIVMLFVVPGMWWARYNIAFLYLPVFAMIYLFIKANQSTVHAVNCTFAGGVITMALLLNLIPNFMTIELELAHSERVQKQIETLKDVTSTHDIRLGVSKDFYGRLFTLYDNGVSDEQITEYVYYVDNPTEYEYKMFDGYCLYYSPIVNTFYTDDVSGFLADILNSENAVIAIAAKDEASTALTQDIISTMRDAELDFDMEKAYRNSYIAVIDNGTICHEQKSDELIEYETVISGNSLEVISAGYECGDMASIKFNGTEYSFNRRGLNIVVFDKNTGNVIENIAIDTFDDLLITQ